MHVLYCSSKKVKNSGRPLDNQTWQTEWKTASSAKEQVCEYKKQLCKLLLWPAVWMQSLNVQWPIRTSHSTAHDCETGLLHPDVIYTLSFKLCKYRPVIALSCFSRDALLISAWRKKEKHSRTRFTVTPQSNNSYIMLCKLWINIKCQSVTCWMSSFVGVPLAFIGEPVTYSKWNYWITVHVTCSYTLY